jgi:hypothetical protein
MDRVLIAVTLMAALVFSVSEVQSATCRGQDSDELKPYYNCGTHTMILKFKVEKSDCFSEIYARAAVGGQPQIILNKQTYKNNDAPDAGPSNDKGTFRWLFTGSKITNAGGDTIRAYIEIYTIKDGLMETKTKYWHDFDINQKVFDFSAALGYFHLYAQPTLCLNK